MVDLLYIQNVTEAKNASLNAVTRENLILNAICDTCKIFHFATLKNISSKLNKSGVKKYCSKYNENVLRKLVREKDIIRIGCSTCTGSKRKNCSSCVYTQYKRVEEARSSLKGNETSKSVFVPTAKGIAKNAEFTEKLRILRNLIRIDNYKRTGNYSLEKDILITKNIDIIPKF